MPKGQKGRRIEIPDSGVYTHDGYFFHHVGTRALTPEQIERLVECGIPYSSKLFTPEEDSIIRENWSNFAEEHGLKWEEAAMYAGKGARTDFEASMKNAWRQDFCLETNFWPKMCVGLPHRSAFQVKRRIYLIFDPAILNKDFEIAYKRKRAICAEQLKQLLRLYRKYHSFKLVAEELHIPEKRCETAYRSYLVSRGKLMKHQLRKLWNLVTELTIVSTTDGEGTPEFFGKTVRKAICSRDVDALTSLEDSIPFNRVADRMLKGEKSCRHAWKKIITQLLENFETAKGEEMNDKMAWAVAFKKVLERAPMVTAEDFTRFLKMLTENTPSHLLLEPIRMKYYNVDDLSNMLLDEGITGFYTANYTEFRYLFLQACHLLKKCQILLFDKLRFRYTLKERLHIISLAFDYQLKKVTATQPAVSDLDDPTTGQSSSAADANPDAGANAVRQESEENRKSELSSTVSRKIFPILNREYFVEALIVYSVSTYKDCWTPPTKLKKYVKSEDVLKLFPAKKNNDEFIGKEEKLLFKDYLPGSDYESEVDSIDETRNEEEPVRNEQTASSEDVPAVSASVNALDEPDASVSTATKRSRLPDETVNGIQDEPPTKKKKRNEVEEGERETEVGSTVREQEEQEVDTEVVEKKKKKKKKHSKRDSEVENGSQIEQEDASTSEIVEKKKKKHSERNPEELDMDEVDATSSEIVEKKKKKEKKHSKRSDNEEEVVDRVESEEFTEKRKKKKKKKDKHVDMDL